jgi:hypothetical protein
MKPSSEHGGARGKAGYLGLVWGARRFPLWEMLFRGGGIAEREHWWLRLSNFFLTAEYQAQGQIRRLSVAYRVLSTKIHSSDLSPVM